MNQEKIIQAIAAYLERETIITGVPGEKAIEFGGVLNQGHFTHAGFCREVAEELAAAIAPHLEAGAGWENAPSWAEWLASNNKGLLQWFEDKPIWDNDLEHWLESTEDGRYKFAGKLAKGKELIQRPR